MARQNRTRAYRGALQALAVLRTLLGLIAIPLAPLLWHSHFVVLILLRPTKDVLLAAGFLLRDGDIGLMPVLLASIPLAVLSVWLFFALGRAYARELERGDLPKIATKVLRPKRVRALSDLLDEKGTRVVLIGRLAAFPSVLLAAAAGASGMRPREFLPIDALGAVLSIAEVLVAGYLFGDAYKHAGAPLTAVGVALLAILLVIVGRALRGRS